MFRRGMMRLLNKKGISLIEAVASIVIITFVMAAALTIIVNVRNQTLAANEKINAIEVATMIRDDIYEQVTYAELVSWLDTDKIINSNNCAGSSTPFSCTILSYDLDGKEYTGLITITFYKPDAEDLSYGVINFKVTVNYYSTRTIELVGMVYE